MEVRQEALFLWKITKMLNYSCPISKKGVSSVNDYLFCNIITLKPLCCGICDSQLLKAYSINAKMGDYKIIVPVKLTRIFQMLQNIYFRRLLNYFRKHCLTYPTPSKIKTKQNKILASITLLMSSMSTHHQVYKFTN